MESVRNRIFIVAGVVLAAILIAVFFYMIAEQNSGEAAGIIPTYTEKVVATPTAIVSGVEEASPSTTEEVIKGFYGKIELSDITVGDDVSIEVPEEINIYDSEPIVIDQETGDAFIKNLEANGWAGHEFKSTDIEGLYFIGARELGDGFNSKESFEKAADDFIEDSGLTDFLEEYGFGISKTVNGGDGQYTAFYWMTVEGAATNSYIRIDLESDAICGECKMYLCENTVVGALPSIPLEEALENAFFVSENGDDGAQFSYVIFEVELEYKSGLPYYCFTASAKDIAVDVIGYAPAISLDEITDDEALLQKFINFGD